MTRKGQTAPTVYSDDMLVVHFNNDFTCNAYVKVQDKYQEGSGKWSSTGDKLVFVAGDALSGEAVYDAKSDTLTSHNNDFDVVMKRGGRIINIALGDVDNNKSINAVDASYILEEYAKLSTNKKSGFSDDQNFAADVNKDGKVNAVDASYILSYYAYCSTTSGVKMSLADYMKKA